ncbi:MAG: hypothetical protein AAFW87_12595, partial [Pseudomonadota bacterium]
MTAAQNRGGKVLCHVCTKAFAQSAVRPWSAVRPGVSELIDAAHPGWEAGKFICLTDMAKFRGAYVEALLESERGELSALDQQVIESMQSGQPISQILAENSDETATFGARMADRVAKFGGSWTFILTFMAILIIWMVVNAV